MAFVHTAILMKIANLRHFKIFLASQTNQWIFTPSRILVPISNKKKSIQNPPIPPTCYLHNQLYNLRPIIPDPHHNFMLDQIGQSHNNNILPTPSSVLAASAISKRSKKPQFFVLPPQVHHHKKIPQKSQKENV